MATCQQGYLNDFMFFAFVLIFLNFVYSTMVLIDNYYTFYGINICIFKLAFGLEFFINLFMDGLILKLLVLGWLAWFLAFQFKVFGCGQLKTL